HRRWRPFRRGRRRACARGCQALSAFDLVIFDNDGVLVDSEAHANRVLCDLTAEYGWALTPEECTAEFLGTSLVTIRKRVEQRLGRSLPDDFEERYQSTLFEKFRTSLMPVAGVLDAIDVIAVATCVASSGTHARIRLALTITGLFDRFAG